MWGSSCLSKASHLAPFVSWDLKAREALFIFEVKLNNWTDFYSQCVTCVG